MYLEISTIVGIRVYENINIFYTQIYRINSDILAVSAKNKMLKKSVTTVFKNLKVRLISNSKFYYQYHYFYYNYY